MKNFLNEISYYIFNPFMLATFLIVLLNQIIFLLYPLEALEGNNFLYLGFLFLMPAITQIGVSFYTGKIKSSKNYRSFFIFYIIFLLGIGIEILALLNNELLNGNLIMILSFFIIGLGIAGISNLQNIIAPDYFKSGNLVKINSYLSIISVIATIIGPLLGAQLQKILGFSGAVVITFILASISCLLVYKIKKNKYSIHIEEKVQREAGQEDEIINKISIKPINNIPVRLITIILGIVFLGIGGLGTLQIPYVTQNLNAGADGYALILSLSSLAMLLASSLYAKLGKYISVELGNLLSVLLIGISWSLFAFAETYIFAVVIMLIASSANSILNITSLSIVQDNSTPQSMNYNISLVSIVNSITGSISLITFSFLGSYYISINNSILIGGVVSLVAIIPSSILFLTRNKRV